MRTTGRRNRLKWQRDKYRPLKQDHNQTPKVNEYLYSYDTPQGETEVHHHLEDREVQVWEADSRKLPRTES